MAGHVRGCGHHVFNSHDSYTDIAANAPNSPDASDLESPIFCLFMIWLLAAIGKVLLGPFYGIDRKKLKIDRIEFWGTKASSRFHLACRRSTLAFAWVGLLFPMVLPYWGVLGSILLFTYIH
jgi:hypothetical protein